MICISGDTHGDFRRFSTKDFPQQKKMSREDYLIITGDFGGVWNGYKEENTWLDRLEDKLFTTLWVDGIKPNRSPTKRVRFGKEDGACSSAVFGFSRKRNGACVI